MRKLVAFTIVTIMLAAVVATLAGADGTLIVNSSIRTPHRAYVGATPLQYDTLACGTGQRIELVSFALFMDDSAQTPTLNVAFQSLNSKRTYLKITPQTFTANQQLVYVLPTSGGPVVFPKDSTIVVFYNLTGATPGTLDTLVAMTTYRVERQ